jgi:6-phosphogluconolactonase
VNLFELSEFGGLLNVVDLGLDTITQYKLNDGSDKSFGKFVCETAVNIVHMPTGSGPRRIRFHPSGSFALVLNECNSSLNVVHVVDRDEGLLAVREAYIAGKSTLRDTDTDGDYGAIQGEDVTMMGAAELIISPCGKWAYVSNRDVSAPNRERSSIAVFSITIKDNGVDVEVYLDLLQHVSTFGEHPRHFSLLHAERQLLVANQKSNNVVSYLWDSQGTGLIDESSAVVSTHGGNILAPACLFILPR